ncbi:hypothetical protein [Nocardia anaemiae]|uniref:hypothetical protein n=1 Tax=Nocardia anaemiae TaxID=263910 RepID=UPI000B2BAAD8|nr:hypothetical protein [Nocardia anaemiae]
MSTKADRNMIVVGVDQTPTAMNPARWAAYPASALRTSLLLTYALPHKVTPAQQLAAHIHTPRSSDAARATIDHIR